ncbi:MAG: hypothetical protein RLZZ500_2007 [Bacteroidota bacterium]
MKQKLLLSTLLTSLFSFGQIINFPDANLKAKLLSPNTAYDSNPSSPSIVLDSNGDGEIEVSETLTTSRIDVSNSGITSLDGLQYFPNLESVFTINNPIPMNSFFGLPQLKYIGIGLNSWNTVSSANIPPNIKHLSLSFDGAITSFCPNELTNLKVLTLYNYPFSSLNLCNTAVESLQINSAPYLTSVNLKNNYQSPMYSSDVVYRTSQASVQNTQLPPPPPSVVIFSTTSLPLTIYVDANEVNTVIYGWFNTSFQLETNAPICDASTYCVNALGTTEFTTFNTFPNPVNTVLSIENKFQTPIKSIEVFTATGQLVFRQLEHTNTVDFTEFAVGLYFLKINTIDGKSYNQKVIKN